jgi:hypothetical protein
MSDNKSGSRSLELITKLMNDLSRELGAMDPDDPKGAIVAAEFSLLLQIKRSVRAASDPIIGQCMDDVAREMATLKPDDPRRKEIVEELMRLRELPK